MRAPRLALAPGGSGSVTRPGWARLPTAGRGRAAPGAGSLFFPERHLAALSPRHPSTGDEVTRMKELHAVAAASSGNHTRHVIHKGGQAMLPACLSLPMPIAPFGRGKRQ